MTDSDSDADRSAAQDASAAPGASPAPLVGVTSGAIIDAVVIGRNEGARLAGCIESLGGRVRRIVYVDSGSDDGSPAAAAAQGALVVQLDPARPFTAARARNAGFAAAMAQPIPPDLLQFVDGDCEVVPGWIETALAFLGDRPGVAVVCGRRRERHPGASVYNRLCDREWATPPGPARACGGDAMMRAGALAAAGGFRDDLIAGEEPELCLRLARAGWKIWRLDAEMTLHDAAITRFSKWWRRSRRAGHAFAEGAALHGAGPERHWVAETRRALVWGLGLPLAAVAGALVWLPAGLVLLAYPAQVVRLALRDPEGGWFGWQAAALSVLGKVAEAQGAAGYWLGRLAGRRRGLIEYK